MFIPAGSIVLSALSTLSGLAAIPAQRPSTSSSDIALEPRDVVTETAYITIPNYATTMTKTWATKPRKPQSDIPGYVDRTELNVEYTKPLSNALRHHTVNEFDPMPTTWRRREKPYDFSSSGVTSSASQDNEKRAEQTVALPVTETRAVPQILIARSEAVREVMTAICHQPPLGISFCEYSIVDDGKAKREVAAKTTLSIKPTENPGDDPEEEVVTVTEHEETVTLWATTTMEASEKTVTAPSTTEFVDEREETQSAPSSTTEDSKAAHPKTTKRYNKNHATASTPNARPSSSASSPSSKKTPSFSDRRSKKPKSTSTSPSASTAAPSDSTSVPLSILPGSPVALKWSGCHRGPLGLCLSSASSETRDVDADVAIAQANHDDGKMYHLLESRPLPPGTVSSSSATASTTATVSPTPDSDLFAFLLPAPSSPSSAMVTQNPNLSADAKIVTATVTVTSSNIIKTRSDEEIDDFFGQQFWTVPKSFTLTGSRSV